LVLANMESLNSVLIGKKVPQAQRMTELSNMARNQLRVLSDIDNKLILPKKN